MSRYPLLVLSLWCVALPDAAVSSDWWKNCPGPGCPAKEPGSVYDKPEHPRQGSAARDAAQERAAQERARQDREAREREQMERERRTRESTR